MSDISLHSHNPLQFYQTVQGVFGTLKGITEVPLKIICSCLVTHLQICMRPKAM